MEDIKYVWPDDLSARKRALISLREKAEKEHKYVSKKRMNLSWYPTNKIHEWVNRKGEERKRSSVHSALRRASANSSIKRDRRGRTRIEGTYRIKKTKTGNADWWRLNWSGYNRTAYHLKKIGYNVEGGY